jgi:hypothetical protein
MPLIVQLFIQGLGGMEFKAVGQQPHHGGGDAVLRTYTDLYIRAR